MHAPVPANQGAQEEFIHQLSPFKNPIHRPPSDYDADHHSLFQVEGRHVMNLWRMLKGELTLCHYSFENVAFHLLHRRCVYPVRRMRLMFLSRLAALNI